LDVGETDPCEEWGSSRGWLGGLFSPLNDLNQTGKKLWTANANRTRNNTWIPEKIFGLPTLIGQGTILGFLRRYSVAV